MAIHIHDSKNLQSTYTDETIHYLPCKIHADCDAQIKKFFNTTIRTQTNGVLNASFRGYPLNGVQINVPTSYQGMLLHESVRPLTESEDRKFYVTQKFKTFTYWNWDKLPSKNDSLSQALEWIDIAEALHAPIETE